MRPGLRLALLVSLIANFYLPISLGQTPVKRPKSTNYSIQKITVTGNQHFSKRKIQEQTSFARPGWWQFPASFFALFTRPKLNAKLVPTDEFAIDSLYHISGYWEAQSAISWEMLGKERVKVSIEIKEGPRTHLSALDLSGGFPDFNSKASGAIRKLRPKQPVDKTKLDEIIFELKKIYANRGFPYTEVAANIFQSPEKDSARITLAIQPNEKVYFGKTEVKGLGNTEEKVVRRELLYREGDLYSREELIESKQRVYATGLFSFVTLDAQNPQDKPVKPDFTLKVVERKPRYFRFGFVTGQEQQQDLTTALSTEFGHRNIFKSGRRLSLGASSTFALLSKFRYLSSRFTLNFYQPWTLGLRIPLDLEAYYEPGAKSAIQPYRIEQFGGNLNLKQELRKQTRLWLTGGYQQVNVFGIPEDQQATFRRDQGINIRRKIGVSLENDSRNSIFVPQGGSLTQLQTEFYGGILGGDHNFSKMVLSWSRYFQTPGINQMEVWAFRLKGGRAFEYRLKDFVPTLDRFKLGGASSIRGYDENSLGPTALDDSTGTIAVVGGKIFAMANLEYRKALFSKFGWSMFLDWGNVWLETENVRIQSMRLSGGLGLQYFSPLGPIRLDYGRRLLHGDRGLNGGRLHLSILYAF